MAAPPQKPAREPAGRINSTLVTDFSGGCATDRVQFRAIHSVHIIGRSTMQASPYAAPPGTVRMRPILDDLAQEWWLILLRGVLAVIFGVLTFIWPGITLLLS